MNREIEFRAWLKPEQYMLSGDELLTGITGTLNEYFKDKDYIFMQYTGLKDKNGVKIFEGDLLRIPASSDWDKKNFSAFEVFYHGNDCADGHVGFQMNRMHNYGSVAGGYCGYKFLPSVTAQFEIIGNIHQNPELLQD